MSSPLQKTSPLPKKAGGNIWIYVILVVVGIIFAVITITALVIAIQKRPRQLYVKDQTTPNKEVFVVVFDESSVSTHKSTGQNVRYTNPNDPTSPIIPGTKPLDPTPFSYPSSGDDISNFKELINSGSDFEPFNGIASQIGKDLAIATKANVEEAISKGAVFKYLKDESKTINDSEYINLPFLIDDSFGKSSLTFFTINGTTLESSINPPAGTADNKTRLAIAFYGVKPNFGDFVTRQYSTKKHPNNPTTTYLKVDATDYLPSATFKTPWITGPEKSDAVYVYNFRIVPFNSTKFNDFVNNESSKYEAKGADGRIKWWSANYKD